MAINPMPVSDDDALLVESARAGSRSAFAALIDRHRPLLLALCRRTLRDSLAAEDAAHEAILQAMLSLDRLRQPDRFGPWLAGIGLNVCRRMLSDRSLTCWSLDTLYGGRAVYEPIDWGSDPAAIAESAEFTARVQRAVVGLPSGQRAAVLLHYLSGLTCAETAATLGIEVGAVKTRLHKARRTLRQSLLNEWKEMTVMQETQSGAAEMRVAEVRAVVSTDEETHKHIVLLREAGGGRLLSIWVGQPEAWAIALYLDKVETPRPMTIAFLTNLLDALDGTVRCARINRLTDEVFYAEAVLDTKGGEKRIDARPSDAMALALAAGAPIYVESSILDRAGTAPDEEVPQTAKRLKISMGPTGLRAETVEGSA